MKDYWGWEAEEKFFGVTLKVQDILECLHRKMTECEPKLVLFMCLGNSY